MTEPVVAAAPAPVAEALRPVRVYSSLSVASEKGVFESVTLDKPLVTPGPENPLYSSTMRLAHALEILGSGGDEISKESFGDCSICGLKQLRKRMISCGHCNKNQCASWSKCCSIARAGIVRDQIQWCPGCQRNICSSEMNNHDCQSPAGAEEEEDFEEFTEEESKRFKVENW